ncbi:hypothetical protein ACJZ2D_007161 [Fusarium nematophilum]
MAAAPEQGKTSIRRTRTGCYTCRTRRRKCDEAKPECGNCVRLGFKCEGYGLRLKWLNDTSRSTPVPTRKASGTGELVSPNRVLVPRASASAPQAMTNAMSPASLGTPGSLNFTSSFPPESNKRDSFLLHHFVTHVSGCLVPFLDAQTGDLWSHPFLRPIIESLAASSLYQLYTIHRHGPTGFTIGPEGSLTAAACVWKRNAILLYTDAINTLRRACLDSSDAVGLCLAGSLVLSLFEWESGSAGSYFAHLDGADTIVRLAVEDISQLSWGSSLLRGWARMHHTRITRQLPFRPLEREKRSPSNKKIAELSTQLLHGSASLSVLLVDAFALRNRLVLETCLEAGELGGRSATQFWREWYSELFDFPYATDSDAHNGKELGKSELLDGLARTESLLCAWQESLPKAAQPTMTPAWPSTGISSQENQTLQIVSWTFTGNGAALQYLNYIMGRILSSRELLDLYLLAENVLCSSRPLHHLIVAALSVIEALDPEESIAHDVYGNGPLWAFETLATCVPDRKVVSHLSQIVMPRFHRVARCGPLLATVAQTSEMLGCVMSEIGAGRMPFLCDPDVVLTDDFSLDESSLSHVRMAVIGRERGRFYRDLVQVG